MEITHSLMAFFVKRNVSIGTLTETQGWSIPQIRENADEGNQRKEEIYIRMGKRHNTKREWNSESNKATWSQYKEKVGSKDKESLVCVLDETCKVTCWDKCAHACVLRQELKVQSRFTHLFTYYLNTKIQTQRGAEN